MRMNKMSPTSLIADSSLVMKLECIGVNNSHEDVVCMTEISNVVLQLLQSRFDEICKQYEFTEFKWTQFQFLLLVSEMVLRDREHCQDVQSRMDCD